MFVRTCHCINPTHSNRFSIHSALSVMSKHKDTEQYPLLSCRFLSLCSHGTTELTLRVRAQGKKTLYIFRYVDIDTHLPSIRHFFYMFGFWKAISYPQILFHRVTFFKTCFFFELKIFYTFCQVVFLEGSATSVSHFTTWTINTPEIVKTIL